MRDALSDLARQSRFKQSRAKPLDKLGAECVDYFKQTIEKRQKKFGLIGQVWIEVVPPQLQASAELSTLSRGTLGVIVQGSSNLYLLKQALLAGLEQQLLHRCRVAGLKKITLKAGKLSS